MPIFWRSEMSSEQTETYKQIAEETEDSFFVS